MDTNATARVLLVGLVALSACGGGRGSRDVTGADDPKRHRDAAVADAATPGDAAQPLDASTSGDAAGPIADAGSDASADDDAQVDPHDPLRDCQLASENNSLAIAAPLSAEGDFALSIGLTGFGVAYRAQTGCGRIGTLPIEALGSFPDPGLLLSDECDNLQEMALLHSAEGWRLAWVDNAAGSAELRTLALSDQMTAASGALITQLTQNSLREYRPVLSEFAGAVHAAWIAADLSSGKRQIDAKNLSDQGDITTLLAADSGHKPVALAFEPMGSAGAILAFVDEQLTPGVWFMRVDKALSAASPVLVSEAVSAGGSVDIAPRDAEGGALIYSVDIGKANHEVRFRALDRDAKLVGVETKIVGGSLQGRDASIARLGGGYVVAYRQIPSGAITKSEIRLTFITKQGDIMRDSVGRLVSYPVADAGLTGGRVTVRVSTDGQLLIGFVDSDADGVKLKLVRKRLDCAL